MKDKAVAAPSGLLNRDELAGFLRVSSRGLDRLRKLGRAPASVGIGRKVFWQRATVQAWFAAKEIEVRRPRRRRVA